MSFSSLPPNIHQNDRKGITTKKAGRGSSVKRFEQISVGMFTNRADEIRAWVAEGTVLRKGWPACTA